MVNADNIPAVTVDEFIGIMVKIYTKLIKSGVGLKKLPTPFLWGPPGVGKSDGVRRMAEILSQKTGKRAVVTDVRLLLFSPVDLHGVPVPDVRREFAKWLRPQIFNLDPSDDVINIMFLDELSAAPQAVQAAAYQICLDRCVGEHKLSDNTIVIAAGNRTTDRSVAYKMPKALCNRLMHFLVEPSYPKWKEWALDNGIDERIIGYLAFDVSRHCVEPENSDLAYPTPRSWSYVSVLIKGEDIGNWHKEIAGCVGVDTALSFEEWCKVYRDLPSAHDIINGRCRNLPRSHDALYALTASLVSALYRMQDDVTDAQIENVCLYALRFPPDFTVSFFGDLNRSEKLRLRLMGNRSFGNWLRKNRGIL